MRPLVTALIDTYNHERYIEQAIVSVLEQGLSEEELEVVVVDDGSSDGTASMVEKFAPRVRLVRKKNGGQASAFNAGFAETRGEIVALLDGDDWWAKGKLKAVLEALEEHAEVAAVGHGYYEWNEDTKESRARVIGARTLANIASPEGIHAAVVAWGFLVTSALTVRRKMIEWIGALPEEMTFMADTAIQAAGIVMGAMILEEPLTYYRQHGGNLYAVDGADREKLRRKYEMTELVYARVYEMLVARGVARETVRELIDPSWVAVARMSLREFGGSPLKTYRTEMRAFGSEAGKASVGYRMFKYGVTGVPMLVLPPRVFYRLRDWYAKGNWGRVRDRVVKARAE